MLQICGWKKYLLSSAKNLWKGIKLEFAVLFFQKGLSCTLLSHRGPDAHVKEVISITGKVSLKR